MKWNPETAQETRVHPVTKKLEKKCSKCECIKPVEFFGPNKKTITGYKHQCKRCLNKTYTKGMNNKYDSKSMKGMMGANRGNK